jgi:RimJ/RimL family protein N-acetyltransferase
MVAEKEVTEDESLRIGRAHLVTQRLILRAPREQDAEQIAVLADNRHVADMLARMPHPYTVSHARAFIHMEMQRRAGAGYAITLAGTGTPVGCAGVNHTERGLELGYWIGEPYWGRGFATEAAHALVDLAFRETPAPVLLAACRVINPASRRVIHKCGFQYAGQGMMNSLAAGQVPIERYRLDRKTWASLRSWAQL